MNPNYYVAWQYNSDCFIVHREMNLRPLAGHKQRGLGRNVMSRRPSPRLPPDSRYCSHGYDAGTATSSLYEQNPARHLKTEFGFNVLEVAKGNSAPEAYHDFVGFDVSQTLVERAFLDTYGLKVNDRWTMSCIVFGWRCSAVRTL